ncbi:MAG: hypothetical protein V2A63_01655 [Patescibacteria group bacterium]
MQFSFSEKRLLIRDLVAKGGFAFRERFLFKVESAFEQAEHERITAEAVGLVRAIRQELENFYQNLELTEFGKLGAFQNFKNKLGFAGANRKEHTRKFIERIVLGIAENKKSLLTLYGLLSEFEKQVLSGEIFGHIFLRKFEELIRHKLANNIWIFRRSIAKEMRPQYTGVVVNFQQGIEPILKEIQKLAGEKEVIEPTEPTKLPCMQLVGLCQKIIQSIEADESGMSQTCLSPDEIRASFQKTNLSDGEVSSLKAAFFYFAEAVKFAKNGGDIDLGLVITNLKKLVENSRDKGSERTPYKLLALQILQHLQIVQANGLQLDFVLKSFRELEAILRDQYFSIEEHLHLELSMAEHVLIELEFRTKTDDEARIW